MKKHYRHENDCLNCGTMLEGKYCHNCGQENLQVKESFGHMMDHAISDYFHFDHQFFHTMKPMLFKPGFLTNEYLAGRRAQYLHPIKMYIFISVVYFLLAFQQTGQTVNETHKDLNSNELSKTVKAINESLLPQQAKTEALKNLYHDNGYISINNQMVKDTAKKAKIRKTIDYQNSHYINPTDITDTTYAQYLASQSKLPEAKRDGWFERYYNKKAYAINEQNINIIEVVGESAKHNFPKLMFILLPLFALILSIAFKKNKKFYVEHLIYAFHLHCFLFLFLSVIIIIKLLIPGNWHVVLDWIGILAAITITVYFYKSLRTVYYRSGFRTITKMIGISIVYSFLFGIFLALFYTIIAATAV